MSFILKGELWKKNTIKAITCEYKNQSEALKMKNSKKTVKHSWEMWTLDWNEELVNWKKTWVSSHLEAGNSMHLERGTEENIFKY